MKKLGEDPVGQRRKSNLPACYGPFPPGRLACSEACRQLGLHRGGNVLGKQRNETQADTAPSKKSKTCHVSAARAEVGSELTDKEPSERKG